MSLALSEWEARQGRAERRRWCLSAVAVTLGFGLAFAVLQWRPGTHAIAQPPAAMLIELVAEAPPASEPLPPQPSPPKPVPKPVPRTTPKLEAPPPSDIAEPARPEPPPQPEQALEQTAPATPAPPPADPRAASGRVTYEGLLLAHLERNKRYPRQARSRHEQGLPYVRFVVTREGKVLSARLERSSGHEALDQEALALFERAQPLPAFTPEMEDDTLEAVVPIQFSLRRN
ncbi:energy transducer TonB [Hydrocarboniphaga sp.]|uniref:energy transducer TonB n=1 Tax=Hydrocarboniphaga sp. TaxID=2033016 RepID=UPI002AB84AD9|nr:energy transducer TonB [Hydrocarboniphaga sp.]MDZ4077331.1 energy transducer TonB [Hydrocarboniphaga sp.]